MEFNEEAGKPPDWTLLAKETAEKASKVYGKFPATARVEYRFEVISNIILVALKKVAKQRDDYWYSKTGVKP